MDELALFTRERTADVHDYEQHQRPPPFECVARHAHADRGEAVLETDGRTVGLTVVDNGTGIPPGGRRSGLANLGERVRKPGGALDITTPEGGGTALAWHAPVTGAQGPAVS
nr:hypothetical protein StreXyl84_00710 [Streptomyces sp. Xyl84]